MIPLEIEFDEVFKQKGGRYKNPNSGSDAYSWILENSRILVTWKRRSNVTLPEPYIDIIDNDEPNAYVTKRGDRYFIGITRGTITLLNVDKFFPGNYRAFRLSFYAPCSGKDQNDRLAYNRICRLFPNRLRIHLHVL